MNKTKVFLISVSSSFYDWLPYPSGCLISHAKKNNFIDENFDFIEPEYRYQCLKFENFHERLKQADIIGLTNYIWNQSYNDKISKLYKTYNPKGIVIYGGVNVPEDSTLAREYAMIRPYVDLFFCGPGEENFKNFLLNFKKNGISNVKGTFTRENFLYQKGKYQNLIIPSPYTDGVFDNIIMNTSSKLGAVLETNRGCPYSCSFCDWGGLTKSKIYKNSYQNTIDTIEYIVKQEKIDKIDLIDANLGMFPEDVDYIKHIIKEKNKRDSNFYLLIGGLAKNGSKYLEEIIELIYNNFDSYYGKKSIKLSFQSHSEQTLKTIDRDNIDNSKLFPMLEKLQNKKINTEAEIIIGLPGDTVEGWFDTIQKNVNLGVTTQRTYLLHVMVNTPLYDKSYKERYKIKTKRIYIPQDLTDKTISEYHDARIIGTDIQTNIIYNKDGSNLEEYECLEFIYECFSYDSKTLQKIFDIWFWFNTLYNSNIARKEIREDSRTIKEQYLFFENLIENNELPFFKKLLDDYRDAVWNTIVKPESDTFVNKLYYANFINKFYLRGNELADIFLNKEIALDELKKIYKDINFDHFVETNVKKLYLMNAEI